MTGGIGSGKSVIAALLTRRGIPVYDSDTRTKSLYDRDPSLVDALSEALGAKLRRDDGSIDKALLGKLIFSDDVARERVESIVYPAVMADFNAWRSQHADAPVVVIESAIILSKPIFDGSYDAAIIVDAPEDLRIQRAAARDNVSEESIRQRIAAQVPITPPAGIPVGVIVNDSNVSALEKKLDELLFILL